MTPTELPRLQEMISLLLEQQLSSDEQQELVQALESDAQARATYRELLRLHVLLSGQHAPSPELAEPTPSRLVRAWEVFYDVIAQPMALGMIISGLFITTILLSLALIVPDRELAAPADRLPSTEFVARLTSTSQASFDATSDGNFQNRDLFDDDTVVLNEGLAVITYDTGARVVLEGPATFHIQGANGGDLKLGKLVARVETEASQGFAVVVPGARIVDLGTEFGAVVDGQAGTYVEVSAGKVDVMLEHGARRPLVAGQSLRVTTSGKIDTELRESKPTPTFAWSLPDDLPPRPLLHWTFDELRADGTVPDISGNGLHGRLNGGVGQASLVAGPAGLGRALVLDGKRQRVLLAGPRERALNRTFRELTIAAWIRPKAEHSGYFLGKMGGDGDRGWQFMAGGDSVSLLFFSTADGDGQTVVSADFATPPPERYTHVAVSMSANGYVRLYINGRLVSQAVAPSGMNWDNTANFCVGHRGDSLPKDFFDGAVDDVRVYGQALTDSEIVELMTLTQSDDATIRNEPQQERPAKHRRNSTEP